MPVAYENECSNACVPVCRAGFAGRGMPPARVTEGYTLASHPRPKT
jgi:hypothetical protein